MVRPSWAGIPFVMGWLTVAASYLAQQAEERNAFFTDLSRQAVFIQRGSFMSEPRYTVLHRAVEAGIAVPDRRAVAEPYLNLPHRVRNVPFTTSRAFPMVNSRWPLQFMLEESFTAQRSEAVRIPMASYSRSTCPARNVFYTRLAALGLVTAPLRRMG